MNTKNRGKKIKSLRSGYTTGACATAAAQAATIALLNQKPVDQVKVELPNGEKVNFEISRCSFNSQQSSCSVIKDAGDDPDVTNGAEICATVSRKAEPGIEICGGKGVGLLTKPGLEMPIGMPAINPVPRQMIIRSVEKVAENKLDSKGLEVTIHVPLGEKLAKRTLNSRLGIIGGISILGTTGIVIPYSTSAYTDCISQSLDVAIACGYREAVLTTGRRSEKFAQKELDLAEECFIQAGDFIGYSLKECANKDLDKIFIWGMIGKISKLALGHMYTNISDSKVDIGFLSEVAATSGVPDKTLHDLQGSITANHLRKIMPPKYMGDFCDRLCLLAAEKCRSYAGGKLELECIMSDYTGIPLGRANAKK